MDISDLKEKLRSNGLYPISVKSEVDEDDAKGLSFDGEFEEYLEALKALDTKVVYIATMPLDEDNFTEDIRNIEEDTFEEIDLCSVNPKLEKFRKEIGNIAIYRIFTSDSANSLNFYIYEEWWIEFVDVVYDAIQALNTNKSKALKKMKVDKENREKDLIKEIRKLKEEPSFRGLKTQRAMISYALEHIAEIDILDPSILRKEVQNLYDKIR